MNEHKEIREALEKATPGRWLVQPGEFYDAVYSSQETKLTVIAGRADSVDAHLIANAPTWLRQLLDENQALKMDDKIKSEYIRTLEADLYHANANLDHASEQLKAQAKEIERMKEIALTFNRMHTDELINKIALREENALYREAMQIASQSLKSIYYHSSDNGSVYAADEAVKKIKALIGNQEEGM